MADFYTASEVVRYLSITYEQALSLDTEPADSFADLVSTNFHTGATGSIDERPLLHVLRWEDVRAARARVAPLLDEEVLQLRLEGLSQHQIAVVLERSQTAVSRAWSSTVEAILRELGSPALVA